MNIEQVRAQLEQRLNAIPANPAAIPGLSREAFEDLITKRRAAEQRLNKFLRLTVDHLPKRRAAVETAKRQIAVLKLIDQNLVAEHGELENKVQGERDARQVNRLREQMINIAGAIRQLHHGLENEHSHALVERGIREQGDQGWIAGRFSRLPVLEERLQMAVAELKKLEAQIIRESAC